MNKNYDINKENLEILDGYFKASNYVSACQLYLKDNPLLTEKLEKKHLKTKIVGHWGTVPGQNFIYTHLNRVICKYDLDLIYISGPGHGGNFFIANSYLEGTYSEFYKDITQDEEGLKKLFKQFSFPKGVSSHVAPQVPGSIHEGGELGYSLAHAYGAILDNPNLICACVVGDGEAETGTLATSWHINKFINPANDGAVLPILHLNGYKISNPTILSRIPKNELSSLFVGYGYSPIFVEGEDVMSMHEKMAKAMDCAIEKIKQIQKDARDGVQTGRPTWPMIILRTPKGWTGPKVVNGNKIEGTFRAHQVPLDPKNEEEIEQLEKWLLSYNPKELFFNGQLKSKYKKFIPKGEKRISANPVTNGGALLKDLILPSVLDFGVKVKERGETTAQDMLELSAYIKKVFDLNEKNKNFRYFCPDEAMSNRLYHTFESTNRIFMERILPTDEYLAPSGRIMDSMLSENVCEGMLEGYVLTGRHGFFASYESFIRIIDSMISQHMKWLKECNLIDFRCDIASINLILTSNVWQQDHNGFSHQDPGFLNHICDKGISVAGVYLPPDANTLISCFNNCLESRNKVNAIVASKHPSYQWLTMNEAIKHVNKGIGVWDWAGTEKKGEDPDIVIACAGDTPTKECLASVTILKEKLPNLKIRFINIVNLLKISSKDEHDEGLTDKEFDELFTLDKDVIFVFHGYPALVHQLIHKRHNQKIHVSGYRENGAITTAFDMRVLNKIDRFNIVKSILKRLPKTQETELIIKEMDKKLKLHSHYIADFGEDLPEIKNWKWK